MPVCWWFIALALLAGGGVSAQVPTVPTYRFSGWLHTVGTNLIDSTGHPARLCGVDHSGAEWGDGVEVSSNGGGLFGTYAIPTDAVEYHRLNKWGFNSVRLLLSWANLEPVAPTLDVNTNIVHAWNTNYLTNVDAMIAGFATNGLDVIISVHQWTYSPVFTNVVQGIHGLGMPVWLYYDTNLSAYRTIGGFPLNAGPHARDTAEHYFFGDAGTNGPDQVLPVLLTNYPSLYTKGANYNVEDGYIDAWKLLAARYSNNPAVIGCDLYNEPPFDNAIHLKKFYTTVGSNIAAVNPRLLLICQDSGFQPTNLQSVLSGEGQPGLSNMLYSIHFYVNNWNDKYGTNGLLLNYQAHTYLTNYQAVSAQWGVPFWVGEFDEFDATNGLLNAPDMARMMQFCRANAIGWSYFAYNRADKPLLTTSNTIQADVVEMLQSGFDTPLNQLSILPQAGQVTVAWPASTNYVLQTIADLSQTNWTANLPPPSTNNFQNTVAIHPTNAAAYFRLLGQ